MQLAITLLGLALAAQTAADDGAEVALPPAAAETAAAESAAMDPSAAEAAAADGAVSPIVINPETPSPTLTPGVPEANASEPAVADPQARAVPLIPASPMGAGATGADASREASVLIGGPKPIELMRALLQTPAADQLAGAPASLGDAVRSAATRSEQTTRAQAYWALSATVAQYHLALQEAEELATLRNGIAAPSQAWAAATDEFDNRVIASRQAAIASQMRLQRLMGVAATAPLPLPADVPHCGRYNTRYDEIFVGRDDAIARRLHDLIPLMQADLAASARQVDEAYDWVNYVAEARDPATDGTGLLRSYELMSARRGAFIAAVRDYNDQIALYAELATPEPVQPERLVSMLIRSTIDNEPRDADAAVQPAGAVEAATPAQPDGGRTFAQRLSLDDLRPLARFRHRERSIVVRRGFMGRSVRNQ